jgi:hypothetical protein
VALSKKRTCLQLVRWLTDFMPAPLLEQNALCYVTELGSRLPLSYAGRLNRWAHQLREATANFTADCIPSRKRVAAAIGCIEDATGALIARQAASL